MKEHCASKTTGQRKVMLAKCKLQSTDRYSCFFERREVTVLYCCEVSPVSTGIVTDVKIISSIDTHNLLDQNIYQGVQYPLTL